MYLFNTTYRHLFDVSRGIKYNENIVALNVGQVIKFLEARFAKTLLNFDNRRLEVLEVKQLATVDHVCKS